MQPSLRSEIAPFYVMEVMRAAEQRERDGHEVLHLEVGQPSTSAPRVALDAAHSALEDDKLGYTGATGMVELRQRLSGWYHDRYGLAIDADRIVVTTGASGSCVLAFLALFDHGQRVGVLEPGYPCYRNDLLAFGAEVVAIPVGHETKFRPTLEQLSEQLPLDGLVLASPSNPTGTVLPREDLAAITAWARHNDVRLVVDEIYHGITFNGEAPSALEFSSETVVFNSFSKYFSMTGWRLGWVVAPPSMVGALERLAQSLTISAPTISQRAALAAFDATDELDGHVDRYRRNREVVLAGLVNAGFDQMAPADGGFYAWVDVGEIVERLSITSRELCALWLTELGIAVTPGVDFDQQRGDRFVRFSYAGATEDMTEAMRRLAAWTKQQLPRTEA